MHRNLHRTRVRDLESQQERQLEESPHCLKTESQTLGFHSERMWTKRPEDHYKTIFDYASDAIFIHDMGGRFLEVNQVACERLGYSREQLLQMTPKEIDFPEYAALVGKRAEELRKLGHGFYETAHVRRDGAIIPTELSSRVMEYKGKPAILSIARDITKRKQAEEATRTSEMKYRTLFENAPHGIYQTAVNGKLLAANRALVRLLGYDSETDLLAAMNLTSSRCPHSVPVGVPSRYPKNGADWADLGFP